VELAKRSRTRPHRAFPSCQEAPQRFPLAALARSYQLVITESFPSGADGVELVGLTFLPGGPTRSLDFNHSFTLPLQEDRES